MGNQKLDSLPNLGWFKSRRWLPTHIVNGLAGGATSKLGITLTISGGMPTAKMGPTTVKRLQSSA